MTVKLLLIYLLVIAFSLVLLFISISGGKNLRRNEDILAGRFSEVNEADAANKNKTKQQIELELLLINNNPLLKVLGIIDKNIKLKLALMVLVFFVYYLFFGRDTDGFSLVISCVLIFIGIIIVPGFLTGFVLKSKTKKIMNDLTSFIDLVAVNVQTGVSIEAALKQVATDFKKLNPDLSYVMLRVIRKSELTGMSQALQDLSISLPTTEIRMFCTVMQQSLNFGSSIYDQLIQLSSDIRELQLLTIEEKLGTLSAKMSVPLILFIMFPIIILILAPGVLRVFPHVF
ncbi:type II secretion system F family protein [Helicobacter pylori]|jgi:tadC